MLIYVNFCNHPPIVAPQGSGPEAGAQGGKSWLLRHKVDRLNNKKWINTTESINRLHQQTWVNRLDPRPQNKKAVIFSACKAGNIIA